MDLRTKILRAEPGKNQAAIFYLGQEGVLIKRAGMYFLFDPYLTDFVDRTCSSEAIVWQRNYPSPIQPAELDFVDYVFCSHAHEDHTDPETLQAIATASPNVKFVGCAKVCRRYRTACNLPEDRILCLKTDQLVWLCKNISVRAVPSAHEELHPDGEGSYEETGFVLDVDGMSFYHAGDCCVYDGLTQRIAGADVGFLPINGRDYFRLSKGIIGNMDSTEAIMLARDAGISLLVPLHFDLYDVNCVNPAYFVDCLTKIAPRQPFHIFTPGEKLLYERP